MLPGEKSGLSKRQMEKDMAKEMDMDDAREMRRLVPRAEPQAAGLRPGGWLEAAGKAAGIVKDVLLSLVLVYALIYLTALTKAIMGLRIGL